MRAWPKIYALSCGSTSSVSLINLYNVVYWNGLVSHLDFLYRLHLHFQFSDIYRTHAQSGCGCGIVSRITEIPINEPDEIIDRRVTLTCTADRQAIALSRHVISATTFVLTWQLCFASDDRSVARASSIANGSTQRKIDTPRRWIKLHICSWRHNDITYDLYDSYAIVSRPGFL